MTLKAVAEKSGVSEGFISQVENNVNSPSVETLVKICQAIGVNAGDLLNQIDKQEKLVVIKKSDWEDMDIPGIGFATHRFFPPENRTTIDSALLLIEPGKSIPVRKNTKNGQEILCVLKGTLELIHGDHTIKLNQGDAVHFWAETKRQQIANRGNKRSVVLWVGTL